MNEAQWIACLDPVALVRQLRHPPSGRKSLLMFDAILWASDRPLVGPALDEWMGNERYTARFTRVRDDGRERTRLLREDSWP